MVNAMVTGLSAAAGDRSAAAMFIETPVTCIPMGPDGAAGLTASYVDSTVIESLPAVGVPMVTPVKVMVCFPAVGPLPLIATAQVLPLTVVAVPKRLPPLAVGAGEFAKKPGGHVTVTEPVVRSVARVNSTITDLPLAAATRSAGAMVIFAALTWPPNAGSELVKSTLLTSVFVLTQKDFAHGFPIGADPMVTVKTNDCEPLVAPGDFATTFHEFADGAVDVVSQRDPPSTAGVLDAANIPAGQVIVTEPVAVTAVARLKATVTLTEVFPGIALPPDTDTPETWPPRAPVAVPSLARSKRSAPRVTFTEKPVGDPFWISPIVIPVKVMVVLVPASIFLLVSTVRTTVVLVDAAGVLKVLSDI